MTAYTGCLRHTVGRAPFLLALCTLPLLIAGVGACGSSTTSGDDQHVKTVASAPENPDGPQSSAQQADGDDRGELSSGAPSAKADTATPPCEAGSLRATLAAPDNSAGTSRTAIIFTNGGMNACSLQGYPGVSFVGNGDGTQLGLPAARLAATSSQAIVLEAAGKAAADLVVSNGAVTADCEPVKADGIRVYPPNSTTSLFVPALAAFKTCSTKQVPVLRVGAVHALSN